ncbi:MAG: hypothetical protein QM669_09185 [Siphonobacter sp.]
MFISFVSLFKTIPVSCQEAFKAHSFSIAYYRIRILTWAAIGFLIELIILNSIRYAEGTLFSNANYRLSLYSHLILVVCIGTNGYLINHWPAKGKVSPAFTQHIYDLNVFITYLYFFVTSLLIYISRKSLVFYIASLIITQLLFLVGWKPRLLISVLGLLGMETVILFYSEPNDPDLVNKLFECLGITGALFITSSYFYSLEVEKFLHSYTIRKQNKKLSVYAQLLQEDKHQREVELEQRSRELTSYTLQELKYSRFLEDIKKIVQEENTAEIRKIPNLIQLFLQGESKWIYFKRIFENVHPDFFNRLHSSYPGLNSNDMRLVALLKMNLSTKEIADILSISPQSANTARYRLRKRLSLKPEEDLEAVIRNL